MINKCSTREDYINTLTLPSIDTSEIRDLEALDGNINPHEIRKIINLARHTPHLGHPTLGDMADALKAGEQLTIKALKMVGHIAQQTVQTGAQVTNRVAHNGLSNFDVRLFPSLLTAGGSVASAMASAASAAASAAGSVASSAAAAASSAASAAAVAAPAGLATLGIASIIRLVREKQRNQKAVANNEITSLITEINSFSEEECQDFIKKVIDKKPATLRPHTESSTLRDQAFNAMQIGTSDSSNYLLAVPR